MNKTRTKLIGILNVVLALTLCMSFVLSALGVQAGSTAFHQLVGGTLTKIDNVDVSAIREANYNSGVTADTYTKASYDGDRWVVVELGNKSMYSEYEKKYSSMTFSDFAASKQGKDVKAEIEKQHKQFLSKLNKSGIDYTLKYSYTVLNNGVAIKINSDAYNKIKDMSEVKSIALSETYSQPKVAVKNDANVYTTGIYDSSNLDEKGAGMVVAILDTGLDYTHEAFQTAPTDKTKLWTKETVAAKMAAADDFKADATVNQVYYSEKIPFAYDYADDDPDVFPSYSSHGTHVAGIVAGQSEYVVNEETGEKFIGVAPQAQLVICKVFTDNLDSDGIGGADTIDIISAVSDCVALGVDVINMSLGSSAGFAQEGDGNKIDRLINEVYSKVKAAGISLVVAASNDYSSGYGGGHGTNLATNPDSGTVGSPSTYDASLSVASINGQKSTYIQANGDENQVAFITEASDGDGNEMNFVNQLYEFTGKKQGETMRFKYVVIGGVGRATNYNTRIRNELQNKGDYDGTIALVKRGDTTFADKVSLAGANGADACIVYNNLSGTIKMSLGEVTDPVPTVSISMDAGKRIVDAAKSSVGYIEISSELKAGPFMSDFSSWGPMPDLQLKPEITAHGGEITSAVAGGYDIYSGTSMASPNMAGAVALLRENLKSRYPELQADTAEARTKLTAMVNQVLMSTATIALNEEGNPYSPRKQGAGLASIKNATTSESYITVEDGNGKVRDKTKIELYDDPTHSGVYEFTFTIHNISANAVKYAPNIYVMTETLASDNKTVAEKAYMLSANTKVFVGGKEVSQVEVGANQSLEVSVKITLSKADRDYIEKSFKNGMYIEGFVSLAPVSGGEVTIGLPYLAFYGDWTDAPLFDYSVYEIADSEKDTSVDPEDKLVASAAATRVLGRYFEDKYILTLGSYLYEMEATDVKIYPEQEKSAISIYDQTNNHTIYELYMVYAGLLRGANTMEIVVTDAATGEVVYTEVQEKVRKSYAAGGSNRGAAIVLDINALNWNLQENSTYNVSLKGTLAYEGGENPDRNTFDFTFTVDYEAPQVLSYKIRFDSYTENKKVKYRVYMDVEVQDNQFVQDVMPCYIKKNRKGENILTLATKHPVPVYGQRGEKSTVSFEITDFYEEMVATNTNYDGTNAEGQFLLVVEDYAMNQATYRIDMTTALQYPDSVSVSTDGGKLVKTDRVGKNTDGTEYNYYTMTLAPNELYAPVVTTGPDVTMSQTLAWFVESGNEYVKAKNGEVFATAEGSATLALKDSSGTDQNIYARINVTVTGTANLKPVADKVVLEAVKNSSGYYVDVNEGTDTALELNPNETAKLTASLYPWYVDGATFVFESDNSDIASVDQNGLITSHKKGTAFITITANGTTLPPKYVKVVVGDNYRIVNYTLYDYYGGEICEIPRDKNVMYLDEDCFKNNTTVKKIILPSTLTEIPENAFQGCINLEYVEINGQCNVVGRDAFKGLPKLTTVKFGKFVDRENNPHDEFNGTITIGPGAFEDCTALSTIENSKRITTALDRAFAGCTALTSVDISELTVVGKQVFAGCTALSTVTTSEFTTIGQNMFEGCTALTSFAYDGESLGSGAFENCTNLAEVTLTNNNFLGIGANAFAGTAISNFTLPDGTYTIGDYAFKDCTSLTIVNLSERTRPTFGRSVFMGATSFAAGPESGFFIKGRASDFNSNYSASNGVLYSVDGYELIAVPTYTKDFLISSLSDKIADGAMSGLTLTTELDLSRIKQIGKYALADSTVTKVKFAEITAIPEGLFAGCSELTEVVGLDNVTSVGDQAFIGCTSLTSVSLPNVTTIGNQAFALCEKLATVSADNLTKVGDGAFSGANITNVNFAKLSSIGAEAFSDSYGTLTVKLGAVTEMGANVFRNSNEITSVVFGEGTTTIGEYALYSTARRTRLTSVTLPASVQTIGNYAFYNCVSLKNIDLQGVKTIGDYAFYNAKSLTEADFGTVETIGNYAFTSSALKAIALDSAKQVGDYAFNGSALTSVTFGALEYVGEYAFAETKLTTVTLPETFDSVRVDYHWNEYDEKGRVNKERVRKETAYGAGAFANIKTLTEIVANGKNIASFDGVLYAKADNGYILLQYPAGKQGTSYKTIDKAVSIAARAFEKVSKLADIEFAYTVKSIGSYAFYNSSVKNYTFNSVQAPVLYATYVDGKEYAESSVEYALFATYGINNFYANFKDFAAKRMYYPSLYADFGLTAIVPKNGTGYDSVLWTTFFTVKTTENIQPTDATHNVMELIDQATALMTETQIENVTAVSELDEISAAVTKARVAYNGISDGQQITLLADYFDRLVKYETALRNKKAALGSPVKVDKLVIATNPTKTRYKAGEQFDGTGMTIKLVFADKSELFVTNYTTDKTTFANGDTDINISCEYNGTTYTVKLLLNIESTSQPDPDVPDPTPTPDNNDGLSAGAIVGIVLGSVAVVAAAAVATVLVIKKKKSTND